MKKILILVRTERGGENHFCQEVPAEKAGRAEFVNADVIVAGA